MFKEFCHSCAAPLEIPGMRGKAAHHCTNCTDGDGNLKSRDAVRAGLAEWFQTWQPDLGADTALARADRYLQAMPAWAE